MRKNVFLLFFISFLTTMSFAQNINVQNAFNYHNMKDLARAKHYIDLAIKHEATSQQAKTWFYKGNIYLEIHLANNFVANLEEDMSYDEVSNVMPQPRNKRRYRFDDGRRGEQWIYDYDIRLVFYQEKLVEWNEAANGEWKKLAETPLEEAYDAYQIAVKYDEIKEYAQGVRFQLYICSEQFYNQGVGKYNEQDYPKAVEYFEKVININSIFNIRDSLATFNAALSSELSGDFTKAKRYYNNLIQMGYKNPVIYVSLAGIHTKEEDISRAIQVLQNGRKIFPDNFDILISETNIYLSSGQTQKARELLKLALKQQPDNPNLYFAIGVNFDAILSDTARSEEEREHAFNEAVEAYTKATQLNPDYFDANYNLGAIYVNKAAAQITVANDLDLNKVEEYDALIALANANLKAALPFLERAHEIDPDDRMTLISLKEIYTRMNMLEELKIVNKKLGL